jgi:hypothetical protein
VSVGQKILFRKLQKIPGMEKPSSESSIGYPAAKNTLQKTPKVVCGEKKTFRKHQK